MDRPITQKEFGTMLRTAQRECARAWKYANAFALACYIDLLEDEELEPRTEAEWKEWMEGCNADIGEMMNEAAAEAINEVQASIEA